MVRKARIRTYLWSKGQPSGSFRKAVRLRLATTKLFVLAFFLSGGSFFCSCHSLLFSRWATITFLLPAWLTGCRLEPNLEPTCPISLPTSLHLPCACCALSSSPRPISSPCTLSFLFCFRHWNWCFDGRGRVFCAVFACAGPPQSPLHTCTTTLLTLLSFFVCVQ